ncbi:iron-containing redox enzyme family protein [Massilia sp. PWRC2]|uniref:iron-containing redox enzyme family protein n=1 Tax=Massilia sp. PWRC2 TaxID=2804626 RepID=UPI003CEB064F
MLPALIDLPVSAKSDFDPADMTAGAASGTPGAGPVQTLYAHLRVHPAGAGADAVAWLHGQLAQARALDDALPVDLADLEQWISAQTAQVGAQYRSYLGERKAGAPRRYFASRSHALHFLKAVGPTKLVDGAWLYGTLAHWGDARFLGLIRTYLEELGDGVPAKNHVALFQKLLDTHAINDWQGLDDSHFVQGAIQLALAHHADAFLPEIIGFNLGYEQLPLHLLICAYELNELGIDPMYFSLHVTIDNADCGHARKAAQAVQALLPQLGGRAAFVRRIRDGYRLNALGASTLSVIEDFDLEEELIAILRAKSRHGQNMHADYCRLAGRSINDWLARPEQIPAMLAAMAKGGWIARGQAAEQSRFWRLLQGTHATMFGVFSDYEQQVLRDWIEDAQVQPARLVSHRAQMRAIEQLGGVSARPATPRAIWRHALQASAGAASDLHLLEQHIAELPDKAAAMDTLRQLMAPQLHASPVGLMATRLFGRLLAL